MGDIHIETIVVETKTPRWSFLAVFWYFMLLVLATGAFHLIKQTLLNRYEAPSPYYSTEVLGPVADQHYHYIFQEFALMKQEIDCLKRRLRRLDKIILSSKFERAYETGLSDDIGIYDYAAEYAGGSVVALPETRPFISNHKITLLSSLNVYFKSDPKSLLQPDSLPGDCFSFYGSTGRIQIKLARPVQITDVSLEHVTFPELISNAPKDFQIFGMKKEWEFLGNFSYSMNGKRIQTFPVASSGRNYSLLELKVVSNYGNPNFTCIYRFRAHSRPFL